MNTLASPPAAADLAGSFRTFGEHGPVYQVVRTVNGQQVHVVVQTGEELDYPVEQALRDPETKQAIFAIAFDLVVADAAEHHPRGVTAA